MAQRVRKTYRGRSGPSSATQLPILAALHAGLPTLFVTNIQEIYQNVKTQNGIFFKITGIYVYMLIGFTQQKEYFSHQLKVENGKLKVKVSLRDI